VEKFDFFEDKVSFELSERVALFLAGLCADVYFAGYLFDMYHDVWGECDVDLG